MGLDEDSTGSGSFSFVKMYEVVKESKILYCGVRRGGFPMTTPVYFA